MSTRSKSKRTIECRDNLWHAFDGLASELGCTLDYLVADAMKQYVRLRGVSLGAGQGESRAPRGSAPSTPEPPEGRTATMDPQPGPTGASSTSGLAHVRDSATSAEVASGEGAEQPEDLGERPLVGSPPPPPREAVALQRVVSVSPEAVTLRPPPVAAPPPQGAPPLGPSPLNPPAAASPARPAATMAALGQLQATSSPLPPLLPRSGAAATPPPLPSTPHIGPPPLPGSSPRGTDPGIGERAVLVDGPSGLPQKLIIHFQGSSLPITKPRFVIGRGKQGTDLTIKDPNVSRQHAMIEIANGRAYMVDMGSTNGVHFHGERVDRRHIANGDEFFICDHPVRLTFG
ncbi:MAG: FHA domain-containing protein [Polyangiaceae bacterium]|nr:FHA domain-containing protein [Polyangiaceae bacterium]